MSTGARTISKAMVADVLQTLRFEELDSPLPDDGDGQASIASTSKQAASITCARHDASYNVCKDLAAKNR